ncbi:MAG: GTPase RsgA, partial [Acidobacteriota bacterium]
MKLKDLGWNSFFHAHYLKQKNDHLIPARVSFQGKGIYRLLSENGELLAETAGSISYGSAEPAGPPVCGDWVLADNPSGNNRILIRFLFPRRSSFSRKQAGTAINRQVIASNIDTICLVSGLDSDFNPRRIERYLAIARESGANPVIILNKADVCTDIPSRLTEVRSVAPGIPVFAVSAIEDRGLEHVLDYVEKGQTIALLGSSGVGKSSILNRLLGRNVQDVRDTD